MAKKICLDAGHYGKYNRSPVVPEYYESDMNWKLHLLLKAELEARGFDVILTRQAQGPDLALFSRGRAAKGCDLFLSIHSNAADKESVDHPVGIYMVDDDCGHIDEASKVIASKLATTVQEVMQTREKALIYDRKSTLDRDGDGKLNDDHYGVLYGAHQVGVPGVILEHSFHTNTRATKWLLQESNLRRLAAAEAKTIADHFGVTKAPEPVQEGVIYRVQVGAFSIKSNAEQKLRAVKAAGFEDAFIVCVDGKLWRVQVGAFSVKANAERRMAELKAAGFSGYVTQLSGDPVPEQKKAVNEIAREVIQGKWGNGTERKQRLEAAGYDYKTVQSAVNRLLK